VPEVLAQQLQAIEGDEDLRLEAERAAVVARISGG
jgi:hypothetical protein